MTVEAFYDKYKTEVAANNHFAGKLETTFNHGKALDTFNNFNKKTKELYALALVLQKYDAGIDLLYKATPSSPFETLYVHIDHDDSNLASAVYCP